MPIRLRITFLFTAIVFTILSLVCATVYYVSHDSRIRIITSRLANRAITTGRLLSQSETFHPQLIQKIDSSTAMSLSHKTVQAYDYLNNKIYSFSDRLSDTIAVDETILDAARVEGLKAYRLGRKDIVAYHYTDARNRLVLVAAGLDEAGLRHLQQLSAILIFSFIGGVVVTFLSGYIFSSRLLLPIRKIADEVNEISARNMASRIAEGSGRDEWHYLAGTLNQLLDRLQESFEMQRRFIANASHELSTPLTAISSQLEVSLQREREAGEYRKVLQSIYQDVRNMSQLTLTLLQFAKAAGTAAGIEIHPIRVDEVLLRLPSELAKANKCHLVQLQFGELPEEEEALLATGNEELLFTAIKNIVINACKYSDPHEAVVQLSAKEQDIIIQIIDKGVGIPAADLPTIFEPFYRSESTLHREGFGLGLSLAYRIIKLHKGTISVQSEVQVGTIFTVVLPSVQKIPRF
ncbi:HAMP domain-containing sensor histidine kinase [Paraflavisolibacter sp. H34]|uniref:sensor histidine kinase n=1 Tax=Huijunlia imazamoxiresistens TaxID=3127457 RepID=UPI00301913D3